jgi:hypothetical protein
LAFFTVPLIIHHAVGSVLSPSRRDGMLVEEDGMLVEEDGRVR